MFLAIGLFLKKYTCTHTPMDGKLGILAGGGLIAWKI